MYVGSTVTGSNAPYITTSTVCLNGQTIKVFYCVLFRAYPFSLEYGVVLFGLQGMWGLCE